LSTSIGISRWTGRGRAAENSANARASTSGSWSGDSSVWLNALTPAAMARCEGSSWSLPWPMPSWPVRLTLEITSIGTLSP
jgi:hypothetical protein